MTLSSPLSSPIWRDSRRLTVLGSAQAYPGELITTTELLELIHTRFHHDFRRQGSVISKHLGIESRYVSRPLISRHELPGPGNSNAELCDQALKKALQEANLSVDDLAYLIGHTTTPDQLLPSNISQVAALAGYRGPFAEFRQACTGFVNALLFAMGLFSEDASGPIAIVGSEVGSVFFDPDRAASDKGQLVNMLQMGDGAGAIIVAKEKNPSGPILSSVFHGQIGWDRTPGLSLNMRSAVETPTNQAEFAHDFASIQTYGLDLFVAGLAAARSSGMNPDRCEMILPHQANGVMDQVLAPLLPGHSGIITHGKKVGNTGSAAIWLAFDEMRRKLQPGEKLLALGAEATKYMYGGFLYEVRVRNGET
jgi:3-oxoacyl-[acyl-carrier-protein] synthase III